VTLVSEFDIGDCVHIDGDAGVRGYVTSVRWYGGPLIRYEVSWINDGHEVVAVIEEWRLTPCESR
jgi:hypothetical protein